MRAVVVELVDFDDDQTCGKGVKAKVIQQGVGYRSLSLLLWSMGRLKDEDRLCQDENTSGVE